MKVLFVIDSLNPGGAEKVLINILKKLDHKKLDIDLLLFFREGIYLKEVPKEITIKKVFWGNNDDCFRKKNNMFKLLYKIYRKVLINLIRLYPCITKNIHKLILKKQYDVEISFLEGITSYIVSNSPNKKSKKVLWIHTDLTKRRTMSMSKEKKVLNKMNKVICVSNDSKESLLKLYPEIHKKVKVIYNPIDSLDITEKSNDAIEYKKQKITLISIGRLEYVKGFDILIKAHKDLIDEGIEHELIILGEGSKRKELESLILDLNVENTVKLIGFKRNPYAYLKNADIFVLSSRYEGFSLALAEALILEKPVVATRCVGPNEILKNGQYGILVDVENINSLKDGMKKLLVDENLRNEYRLKAIKRKDFFDINEVMKKINNEVLNLFL